MKIALMLKNKIINLKKLKKIKMMMQTKKNFIKKKKHQKNNFQKFIQIYKEKNKNQVILILISENELRT